MNQNAIDRLLMFCSAAPPPREAERDMLLLVQMGMKDFDLEESPDAIKTMAMLGEMLNSLLAALIHKDQTPPEEINENVYFRTMATLAMISSRFVLMLPTHTTDQ